MKRKKRKKLEPTDGLGPKEKKQITTALRQVWGWSRARRIAAARAVGPDGFSYCEKCKKRVPKVFIDHKKPCGDVLEPGYITRMFAPSKNLQAWCKKCHQVKTNRENRERRERERLGF